MRSACSVSKLLQPAVTDTQPERIAPTNVVSSYFIPRFPKVLERTPNIGASKAPPEAAKIVFMTASCGTLTILF